MSSPLQCRAWQIIIWRVPCRFCRYRPASQHSSFQKKQHVSVTDMKTYPAATVISSIYILQKRILEPYPKLRQTDSSAQPSVSPTSGLPLGSYSTRIIAPSSRRLIVPSPASSIPTGHSPNIHESLPDVCVHKKHHINPHNNKPTRDTVSHRRNQVRCGCETTRDDGGAQPPASSLQGMSMDRNRQRGR